MASSGRHDETVRTGTWLAAAAGLIASAVAVGAIIGEAIDAGFLLVLGGPAMIGATISMALFWRWLAPTERGFSLGRSALGGALSAIVSSIVMWPPIFFYLLAPTLDVGAGIAGVAGLIMAMIYFGMFALIFSGWITVPLGIVAALAVTFWARRRIAAA